ncbi:ABC transporter ATP-binding protein [Paracoccus sp. SCSIO 75233]|uniref:ABC transporter ATP-binding protein n=1 Tax=Paracoccus sp. SCSIO 75233 TaxID=3017782 RepID=UPI0022F03176|nr:ATP-binding cassette domain-containing protein [Paracoccus sp. SCSIO 75233]WBU53992.1 ATP-binding cassette domain-containing protein [Paracoccus sp. SCSIO 75233]
MSVLRLENIGQSYFGRTVLDRINIDIAAGEILALVGPSGCGKSTLAHLSAGLSEPRTGRVLRGYTRHAMVFQEPRLMPWRTASSNIGYSLVRAGWSRSMRRRRVAEVAEEVALDPDDLKKYPGELSGGMKQRVAIARALAANPDFIFFDEPFTALDVALRRRMQDLVIATCADKGIAGLFITHDLEEAARLSHRIAVLDTRGRGVLGTRSLKGTPSGRTDETVHDWVKAALRQDPIFRHIHDVDERQTA